MAGDLEHYRQSVIPGYMASDLNELIRELAELRDQLRDPDDHKARRTIERGRAAATDLDQFLRRDDDEVDTVADLITADELDGPPDERQRGIRERVTLLALALVTRDEKPQSE